MWDLYSAHVHRNKGTCHPVEQCVEVFFVVVFGQQWWCVAQRDKLDQDLATQAVTVTSISLLLVLVSSLDILNLVCHLIFNQL